MARRRKEQDSKLNLQYLEPKVLVKLWEEASIPETEKDKIIAELKKRGDGLPKEAFEIAYPDHEVMSGQGIGGFYDVDGFERRMPTYFLQTKKPNGKVVKSKEYS